MKCHIPVVAACIALTLLASGCGGVSYTKTDAHAVSTDAWIGKEQKKLIKMWGKPAHVDMKETGGGAMVVYSTKAPSGLSAQSAQPVPANPPDATVAAAAPVAAEVALAFDVNPEGEVAGWTLRTPWGDEKSVMTGEDGDVERTEVWVGMSAKDFIGKFGEPARTDAATEASGFQLVYFNQPIEKQCIVKLTEGARPAGCPALERVPDLAEFTIYVDGQNRISKFKLVASWGAVYSEGLDMDEFRKGFMYNPLETPMSSAVNLSSNSLFQWAGMAAAIYFMSR